MAKIKTVCGTCKNCSPEGFTLFKSQSEIAKLIEKFPFYKAIKSNTTTIGKIKKEYLLVKCERLTKNGLCENYPINPPAWCKVEE